MHPLETWVSIRWFGFVFVRSMVKGVAVTMDKRGGATETENGDAFPELNRVTTKYPHRYTKVGSLPFPLPAMHGAAGHRSRGVAAR